MLYVYAIAEDLGADIRAVPLDVGILPETSVVRVPYGPFIAVVSVVPEAIFGAEALPRYLEDCAWTRERVLAHERVVAALVPVTTVLPLKFCTLFSGEATLQDTLMRHRATLEDTLSGLRGAREWGVKLFVDPSHAAPMPAGAVAAVTPGAGAAFFRRKRDEQEAVETAKARLEHCVVESHRRLAVHARAAVSNPLQPPALHGRPGEMALNGAYLVGRDAEPAFRLALAELEQSYGESGIHYELTGPWGPYNFAGAPLANA
ncbi:MAG: gas vesicle protein [Proteobacteria bacterium]|nr:gas vesicle protein [Pseudomonadota bacterium]